MSDTGGNKSKLAYEEAQRQYLEAGKRYSSLLRDAMELDPNIVKIAEEILVTGDRLSIHDNKLLIRFYNELRAGSKIDKKYYDLLVGLKRAKNELDIATDHLITRRVSKILAGAGIPPRDSNYSDAARISQLNNPDASLLEKISLPGALSAANAHELEKQVANQEIVISGGSILPQTKSARDFLKGLEKDIRQDANDEYLLADNTDPLKMFSDKGHKVDLTEMLRAAGKSDHIRELERRIDAGDIHFVNGELVAINGKGSRYLGLLNEELVALYRKKIDSSLTSINQTHIEGNRRLVRTRKAVDSLRQTTDKHARFGGLVENTTYNDLLDLVTDHRLEVESRLCQLLTGVETISRAFIDIKKRLVLVASKEEVDVEGLISLLVASRHLSKFESEYEKGLSSLEAILGLKVENGDCCLGPISTGSLAEGCRLHGCNHFEDAGAVVRDVVASRIQNRKHLSEQMDKLLMDFVFSPAEVGAYGDILCSQDSIKRHIGDVNYAGGSLYNGIGDLSCLIEELVELEVEKREKIADFVHEFELAHKELWLAGIKNNNKDFITENFPDLDEGIKIRAAETNEQVVALAREDIKKVIDKFRSDHKTSSEDFGKQLKNSLNQLKTDGDIVGASTKLKNEYKKMLSLHGRALDELEIEIGVLERRLSEFEVGSKNDLEKVLLQDIRKNI